MWTYLNELYDYYVTSQEAPTKICVLCAMILDPRIKDYPFMDSPKASFILVALYLIFVKIIGPAYMKNRPAFEIQNWIIIYNAYQSMFSLMMLVLGTWYSYKSKFNILCQLQEYKYDYYSLATVHLSYWFLIGRFTEFIDTIFFILRKKNNQVTTLHVVHHAIVPLICWIGVKMVPGGHYVFAGYLNSFVHFFMYLYYMLAAMGPEYKKYLWWKKYLTVMQLAQFAIVFVHTIWTLVTGCDVPKLFGYIILLQSILFYNLFLNFYKETFKNENNNDGNKKAKYSMSFENYYQKYKHLFEMCIPNQHALLDNDDIDNHQNDENNINSSKNIIDKQHIQ